MTSCRIMTGELLTPSFSKIARSKFIRDKGSALEKVWQRTRTTYHQGSKQALVGWELRLRRWTLRCFAHFKRTNQITRLRIWKVSSINQVSSSGLVIYTRRLLKIDASRESASLMKEASQRSNSRKRKSISRSKKSISEKLKELGSLRLIRDKIQITKPLRRFRSRGEKPSLFKRWIITFQKDSQV